MWNTLPLELAAVVLKQLDTPTLLSFCLVSKANRRIVEPYLLFRVTITCSTAAQLLFRRISGIDSTCFELKDLTLARGIKAKWVEKGGKKIGGWETDPVKADDLIDLCRRGRLQSLTLRALSFTALRRRQNLRVMHLTSLTILGPFNLHSLGILLVKIPHLKHLALRKIVTTKEALHNLATPTYTLHSFALFEAPQLSSDQLYWMLRSTEQADSLKELALEWNGSPRILNQSRYVISSVSTLSISTITPGLVENLMLHFPSLQHLTFQSTHSVNVGRLLSNLEIPLLTLVDKSLPPFGLCTMKLEQLIRSGRLRCAVDIKRIVVQAGGQGNRNREIAVEGVEFEEEDAPIISPWIPSRYVVILISLSLVLCVCYFGL